MSRKNIFIILAAICTILILVLLGVQNSPRASSSIKPDSARAISTELFALKATGRLHRYDPALDPKTSPDAARDYYSRRKEMIRKFRGDRQMDEPLERVKSGQGTASELITALGSVRRYEIIEALPYVVNLLNHHEKSVQRVTAKILCWFGDRRGYDFVMNKMEGEAFDEWIGLCEDWFSNDQAKEYIPRIKALREGKGAAPGYVFALAEVLAKLGDADSAKYLLPVIEREPHVAIQTILSLKNVRDPSVTDLMQRLSKEGSTNGVKHAADIVLANQGDATAQQRLIEAAKRVEGLPQPENADGTDKPGMKSKIFGEATPAWDGDAVFALEHGMEVVDPVKAVPVLRDIAIYADNVRFSRTAIELLAKIGDEAARNALIEVARALQDRNRTFEDTLFTTAGKALVLFGDETSTSLATAMFSGDRYGMEASQLFAETRGWDGLFKLDLFY